MHLSHPCGPGAQASEEAYLIISDLGYPFKVNLRYNAVLSSLGMLFYLAKLCLFP